MDLAYEALRVLLVIALWYPLMVLAIISHEAGHYTVYRLMKKTPLWVQIGSGDLWFKFRHKGTWIQFHKKLHALGFVSMAPGHYKSLGLYGVILMLLAGPVAHFLFGLSLFYLGQQVVGDLFSLAFKICGLIQVFIAIKQLVPMRVKVEVRNKPQMFKNDGYQILSAWQRRDEFKIVNENW